MVLLVFKVPLVQLVSLDRQAQLVLLVQLDLRVQQVPQAVLGLLDPLVPPV
jgi:hypothetical protein